MIELFMSQRAFFYSSLGLPMAGVTHVIVVTIPASDGKIRALDRCTQAGPVSLRPHEMLRE